MESLKKCSQVDEHLLGWDILCIHPAAPGTHPAVHHRGLVSFPSSLGIQMEKLSGQSVHLDFSGAEAEHEEMWQGQAVCTSMQKQVTAQALTQTQESESAHGSPG